MGYLSCTREWMDRRNFFRQHGIDPDDNKLELRWFMDPKDEYEELEEYSEDEE